MKAVSAKVFMITVSVKVLRIFGRSEGLHDRSECLRNNSGSMKAVSMRVFRIKVSVKVQRIFSRSEGLHGTVVPGKAVATTTINSSLEKRFYPKHQPDSFPRVSLKSCFSSF